MPDNQFAVGTRELLLFETQKFDADDFYWVGKRCTDEYLLDLNIPWFSSATLFVPSTLSDTFHVSGTFIKAAFMLTAACCLSVVTLSRRAFVEGCF